MFASTDPHKAGTDLVAIGRQTSVGGEGDKKREMVVVWCEEKVENHVQGRRCGLLKERSIANVYGAVFLIADELRVCGRLE